MSFLSAWVALLAATPALAGGVNLSWDECGTAGSMVRAFACNTNSGTNTLVASFVPNADIPDMAGVDLRLGIVSDFAINDWWRLFNAGSCRSNQPRVDVLGFPGACTDFWAGQASGVGAIGTYGVSDRRASLVVAWATTDPGPVNQLTEYYAVNIRFDNSKTVGDPSCDGCSVPMCLILNEVRIAYGPQASMLHTVDHPTPDGSMWVFWQNEPVSGCFTPTINRSWGQIKSLYR